MISRALPYAWKLLQSLPKSNLTIEQIKQMGVYIGLLKKSNSSRRALMYLKTYAYRIPEEFSSEKS